MNKGNKGFLNVGISLQESPNLIPGFSFFFYIYGEYSGKANTKRQEVETDQAAVRVLTVKDLKKLEAVK